MKEYLQFCIPVLFIIKLSVAYRIVKKNKEKMIKVLNLKHCPKFYS